MAASKTLGIILSLQDKYSKPLLSVTAKTKGLAAQAKKLNISVDDLRKRNVVAAKSVNSTIKDVDNLITRCLKLIVVGHAVGSAIKLGFSTATELETLRANIETVTKSGERATAIMKYAVNMANTSAFSNSDLISAAASLETYGLTTEKYLKSVGDAAAITGKDVSDLARAFGKATTTGQFDSLTEIGITREALASYAKLQGITLFDGTKIRDAKQFADILASYMDSRYAGGMEKQAKTVSGLISTVKGMASTALAGIMGVSEDGSFIVGGAMDYIRQKIQLVIDKIAQWQADGTLARIGRDFTWIFNLICGAIEWAITLMSNPIFRTFAVVLGGIVLMVYAANKAYAAYNAIIAISKTITAVMTGAISAQTIATNIASAATAVWNAILAINPIFLIITAIGLLIIWIYQLIKNWDKVVAKLKEVWDKITKICAGIRDWWNGLFGDKTVNVDVKTTGGDDIPAYASGTTYHPGGLARINERGGEIVNLPSGASVIPAARSKAQLRGGNTINIYIEGARRSDEEIADMVAARVTEALDNV